MGAAATPAPERPSAPAFGEPKDLGLAYQAAVAAAGGEVVGWYEVAGLALRMRLAGQAMNLAMTPALAHLRLEPPVDRRASLTVDAWDSASSGVAPPPSLPACRDGEPVGSGYLHAGDHRALSRPGWGQLDAMNSACTHGWHWVADGSRVPYWETAAPLLPLLHWWSGARGMHLVHGAAVGTDSGGALLVVGRSGSGKSTTALACAAAGLRYLGDDYVIVDPGPPPVVHSVFASAKLDPGHAARFPELVGDVWNSDRLDTEKAVTFVHQRFAERIVRSLPLAAVARCSVSGGARTTARPASRAEVLAGLAPSTIFQLAGTRRDALAGMTRLVAALPAFALEVGGEPADIPDAVRALLDTVAVPS